MTTKKAENDKFTIKPGYLFGLALIFAALGIFGLRSNNLKMADIREGVYIADEKNQGVSKAIDNLRLFIYKHMNASTNIELKYSYERAVQKTLRKSEKTNNGGNNIFEDLPADCNTGEFVDSTAPCVQEYIDKRIREIGGDNSQVIKMPDKRLYVYDFRSPLLSFDFAGWMLILSSMSALAGAAWIIGKFIRDEVAFYKGDIEGL